MRNLRSVNASEIFHSVEYKYNGHCIGVIARTFLWCTVAHRSSAMAVNCASVVVTCLLYASFFVWFFHSIFILPIALLKHLQERQRKTINNFYIERDTIHIKSLYNTTNYIALKFSSRFTRPEIKFLFLIHKQSKVPYLFGVFLIGAITADCFNASTIQQLISIDLFHTHR